MSSVDISSIIVEEGRTPRLIGKNIAFHGVNKSGSLSFSRALQKSYDASGQADQFMCRYLGIPKTREEALKSIAQDTSRGKILIDHGLVGLQNTVPNVKMATILRHPIRRMFSCYFWLNANHPEKVMGRDFISWLRTEFLAYSQIRQFAFDHMSPSERGKITTMGIGDIAERAIAFFENHIAWYGITELFEESLASFHWELGFTKHFGWEIDERNKTRPKYEKNSTESRKFDITKTEISRAFYQEIEQIMSFDIVFYETYRQKFLKYAKSFDFSKAQ